MNNYLEIKTVHNYFNIIQHCALVINWCLIFIHKIIVPCIRPTHIPIVQIIILLSTYNGRVNKKTSWNKLSSSKSLQLKLNS